MTKFKTERFIKYLQDTPADVLTDRLYDNKHRRQEKNMAPSNDRIATILTLFKEIKMLTDEKTAEDLVKDSLFAEQMEANRLLKARKAKERLEANKNVLRSYRIKE